MVDYLAVFGFNLIYEFENYTSNMILKLVKEYNN